MYTDLQGWIDFAPKAVGLLLLVLGGCGLVENTERGRRITDALINRIVRTR